MKLTGKVAVCINCDGGQSSNDYIFTKQIRQIYVFFYFAGINLI